MRSEVITIKKDTVRLELSPAEAEALAAVINLVQGSPTNSPRKLVLAVKDALAAAGVRSAAMTTHAYRHSLNGFTSVTLGAATRHAAELLTDTSRVAFREYTTVWSKAERGEDN